MPKKAKELSALVVRNLTDPGLHFVGGVAGLALQVTPSGARSWILRVMIAGKRRDMGLGGFPDQTLAGAKDAARDAREKIKNGIDPVADALAKRSALLAARASSITFSEAAAKYIATHEKGWKSDKHADQWRNTLAKYADPVVGNIFVREIEQSHVMRVLEPVWLTKTETATRLRGRIEKILGWAQASGFRDKTSENPARWENNLEFSLAAPDKVKAVEHHPSLPFDQLGQFMAQLREQEGIGARALEYLILTAGRTEEVIGARWEEVDLAKATWTIPAARMKMQQEHLVALNAEAVKLLESLPRAGDFIFPNQRKPKSHLSTAVFTRLLKRMSEVREEKKLPRWVDPKLGRDAVPHGFRSTFSNWANETTNYHPDVIEAALAHKKKDKVKAAYHRDPLYDKRVHLMRDWGRFARKVQKSADVVSIMHKSVA